jgi:hypothetical protein
MKEKSSKTNQLLKELVDKQLKSIQSNKRLQFNDLKRISKYVDTSIFDSNVCAMWNGYITNINNAAKGTYINFYFRQNKVTLHRLLYSNFVGELSENEYLKFNCSNKGKCCNIHHMTKFKYNTTDVENDKIQEKKVANVQQEKIKNKENNMEIIDFNLNFD